jgi:hypothetical protein
VEINQSSERPKRGHELRLIVETVLREQHLAPTARDLTLDVPAGLLTIFDVMNMENWNDAM